MSCLKTTFCIILCIFFFSFFFFFVWNVSIDKTIKCKYLAQQKIPIPEITLRKNDYNYIFRKHQALKKWCLLNRMLLKYFFVAFKLISSNFQLYSFF